MNRREGQQRLLDVSRETFKHCRSDDTVGIGTEKRNSSEQRLRGSPSNMGAHARLAEPVAQPATPRFSGESSRVRFFL